MDVVKGALVLKLFPAILRPFIARFCTNVPTNIDEGIVHFGPAILERLGKHGELGDKWTDRPNDMLQWLIDNAPPHERSVRPLVLRIFSVNFAAVHTTTTVLFGFALGPWHCRFSHKSCITWRRIISTWIRSEQKSRQSYKRKAGQSQPLTRCTRSTAS